jgi:hypothetical protein
MCGQMGRTLASFISETRIKNILLDSKSPYLGAQLKKGDWQEVRDFIGAPGRIRTADPQIRSLRN